MGNLLQILLYIFIIFLQIKTHSMEPKQTHRYETDPPPYYLDELTEVPTGIVSEYVAPQEIQQSPTTTFSDLKLKYGGYLPRELIQALYKALNETREQKVIIYNNTDKDFYIHAAMATALKNSYISCYFDTIFEFIKMDFSRRVKFDFQPVPAGKTCSFPIPPQCVKNQQTYVGICAHKTRHMPFLDQCYLTVSDAGTVLELNWKDHGLGITRKYQLKNLVNTPLSIQLLKMNPLHLKEFSRRIPLYSSNTEVISAQGQRSFNHFFPFYTLRNHFIPRSYCYSNGISSVVNVWDHPEKDQNQAINMHLSSMLPMKGTSTNLGITESEDGTLSIIKIDND